MSDAPDPGPVPKVELAEIAFEDILLEVYLYAAAGPTPGPDAVEKIPGEDLSPMAASWLGLRLWRHFPQGYRMTIKGKPYLGFPSWESARGHLRVCEGYVSLRVPGSGQVQAVPCPNPAHAIRELPLPIRRTLLGQ